MTTPALGEDPPWTLDDPDTPELPQGPAPLSRTFIWTGSAIAAVVALIFSLGLPLLANSATRTVVPPDAITAGAASLEPQPGWTIESSGDEGSVATLQKDGAVLSLRTVSVQRGQTPNALLDQVVAETGMRAASPLTTFTSPGGDPGVFVTASDGNETGVIGVVVSPRLQTAAQVVGVAPATAPKQLLDEMARMIGSVRVMAEAP